MNKSLIATAVLAGVSLMSGNKALAQELAQATANQSSLEENLQLFRKDLRSVKKQIVAANMGLTDAEAQQFWPIYDSYTAELVTIMDKKYALLNEYARNYTTMTNEQAESYIKGRAAVEESLMQLRLKYLPNFRKALSGKSIARFFQMDWRLGLIMDLQLASQAPLIEP
jgi:septal ring factor EnvC (AmiA/AmiB activator)